MEKTFFIAFEGIDGCGKDTQLHKLIEYIKEDNDYPFGNKYSNIWITREPSKITKSGIEIAELIRKRDVSGEEASELYVKDRREHTQIIKEVLKYSHVFISRYDFSTLSYQMTQGMDFDYLYNLHKYGEEDGCIIPDITIVFDLPVEVAIDRTSKRNSVFECFEKKEFQVKLKKNLLNVMEKIKLKDKRNILIVNSNQSIEAVSMEMLEGIKCIIDSKF